MKLLAIRQECHDSNFSYYDGNTVKYFKSERHEQVKHHFYGNHWQWRDVIYEQFGVDYKDLDEIAVVITPGHINLPKISEEIFPSMNYNNYFASDCPVERVHHHYAHALSAWMLTDDFDVAITIDGFGDDDTSWGVFKPDEVISIGKFSDYGSVGYEMSGVGLHAFGVDRDIENDWKYLDVAGKIMGLQSYGNLDKKFYETLIDYELEDLLKVFDLNRWIEYKGSRLLAEHTKLDWLRTIHEAMGEILVKFFSRYADKNDKIVYSGGVAQNVIWNTKLKEHFPNMIIPPHCGDEGLSLGALEFLRKKHNLPKFKIDNFPYSQVDESPKKPITIKTIKETAKLLAEGNTVSWYQGNGEVGPRALGNRSILMNPTIHNAKELINTIKNRENYRPFGASILKEYKDEYFDSLPDNPHMLYVGKVKVDTGISCITHIDGTCRVQTVDEEPKHFRMLLEEFYKLTGVPILLNTSLNLAGKPIAGKPEHIMDIKTDYIVVGDYIKEVK